MDNLHGMPMPNEDKFCGYGMHMMASGMDMGMPMNGTSSPSGMSMYMNGIVWTQKWNQSCLIFLFEGWIIDTQWKMILACVGTVLIGVVNAILQRIRVNVVERYAFLRRTSISKLHSVWMHSVLE